MMDLTAGGLRVNGFGVTRAHARYVGNSMAGLVMQSLGCDVSALNTVQFSNHTGYGRFRGTRSTDAEILDLYRGLCDNDLAVFDFMLSGYVPGANAVRAVGQIALDQRQRADSRLFWVLDPVMGDAGQLYVSEEVVPVYRELLPHSDLILPNQFELELLAQMKISSHRDLMRAIDSLHVQVPHIVVTSVSLMDDPDIISVVGSSRRADCSSRVFRVDVPRIDCHFVGTGDMFAALTIVGIRETFDVRLQGTWSCDDSVKAIDLPLARVVERVLDSMHAVLTFTKEARDRQLQSTSNHNQLPEDHARQTKAAEIRVVRCFDQLRAPTRRWRAAELRT